MQTLFFVLYKQLKPPGLFPGTAFKPAPPCGTTGMGFKFLFASFGLLLQADILLTKKWTLMSNILFHVIAFIL